MADNPNSAAPILDPKEFLGPRLDSLRMRGTVLAVLGLVLCAVGALLDPARFLPSYLFAYAFWLGVTTGSLGLLMLHHVVGGGWGFLIRRMLEAATRLLPVMLVLFLPIALGIPRLYEWARPEAAHDAVLQAKAAYLNVPFFVARTLIYFAIWILLAHFLNRWSAQQDEREDPLIFHRLNLLSAPGIILYVLTTTFAMVDWLMSLAPHWNSSIIGLLFVAGQGLSALAVMLALVALLAGSQPLLQEVPRRYFRDLGNLLMAFVLMWAYMSFSQYLIIYSGNVAEDAGWYLQRRVGGWGIIGLALIPLHFALPFLLLLVPAVKASPKNLARVALFLVVMRLMDLFWWVMPSFRNHLSLSFSDFGAPLLLGGLWLLVWSIQIRKRPLIPAHDPRLQGYWPLSTEASHG